MDLKNSVGVWAFGPAVTRFVPPGYHHGGDLQAFVVEVLITFILVFVVMAVATDERAPAAIAPIAVGFALAVGVFIAGTGDRGFGQPGALPRADAGRGGPHERVALRPRAHRRGILGALLYDRTMAKPQGLA